MSVTGAGAGTDWSAVEGLDVFTSDEEEVGTVERVVVSSTDASQYYLHVQAGGVADLLGSDTLYVPDQDVLSIAADRVILNATTDTLARPDWLTPPDETDDAS